LAEVLLERIDVASDYTITDLAVIAGVSNGTISQLCRRLGLSGYRQLRLLLAKESVRAQMDRGHWALEVSEDDPQIASLARSVFEANTSALASSARSIRAGEIERAIDLLAQARHVQCVGVGASGLVAAEAALKLREVGVMAVAHADSHAQMMSAALLGKGDVLLAVSPSGRAVDVVKSADLAHAGGAAVVALTGSARSPLTGLADISIVTLAPDAGPDMEERESTVLAVTVIHVIFAALLARGGRTDDYETTRSALRDRWIASGRITGPAPLTQEDG
jgi:RpiR family carbohydrate utilization transcriptional regulator